MKCLLIERRYELNRLNLFDGSQPIDILFFEAEIVPWLSSSELALEFFSRDPSLGKFSGCLLGQDLPGSSFTLLPQT